MCIRDRHERSHDVDHRDLDPLSLSGPLAMEEGGEHRVGNGEAADLVCNQGGDELRLALHAAEGVGEAGTGLPDTFRRMEGEPQFVPTLIADKVCGLTIAYSVLAALLHRERTGEGQRIEVPMVDVMTAFMLVEHAGAATARPPQGEPGYLRILSPNRRPQRTKDGWVSVLPYTRKNFEDIFRAGGRTDLVGDER